MKGDPIEQYVPLTTCQFNSRQLNVFPSANGLNHIFIFDCQFFFLGEGGDKFWLDPNFSVQKSALCLFRIVFYARSKHKDVFMLMSIKWNRHALSELIHGSRNNFFLYGTWSWHSQQLTSQNWMQLRQRRCENQGTAVLIPLYCVTRVVVDALSNNANFERGEYVN